MEESINQNETPELSKKSNEINDINNSLDYQNKDINQLNITSDILSDVRKKYIIIQN